TARKVAKSVFPRSGYTPGYQPVTFGGHVVLLETQRFVKRRCDMNRITRMLTITGLGLFAGLTIGTGPAMAATNTSQSAVKPSAAAAPGDHVEGYYDTRDECQIAGRVGERFGRWDDWNCYPARGDWHEGDWVLVVDNEGHHGFPFGHDHG